MLLRKKKTGMQIARMMYSDKTNKLGRRNEASKQGGIQEHKQANYRMHATRKPRMQAFAFERNVL